MIEFGCLARYFTNYRDEVQFAKDNGFSFMQIWYDKKGLNLKPIEELLPVILDVAHMDNIEHLKELVSVKMPQILHVADRRLEEIHEHLPIGKGNIDFTKVFGDVLTDFDGKIFFEIIQSDEDIIAAKKYFEDLLCLSQGGCL
ncbi:MAG TPA: hypothetical protein PK733_19710 [Clostridiales bacterium]|nr:hypothetical protein [Clostridiales bacterium]